VSEAIDDWIADDPSIPDDTWTYRRFPSKPSHLIPDALGGPAQLATSVYSYGTTDGMSINLSNLMQEEGITAEDLVADWSTHHVARLPVGTVRENESQAGGVVVSPDLSIDDQRIGRSHGLVRVAIRPGAAGAKTMWNDLRLEMLKASEYITGTASTWIPQPSPPTVEQ
jgi:hypothetical protein